MKHFDENFLDMVLGVLDNLKAGQIFWSKEPVIVSVVNEIERDFNLILGNLNVNSRLEPAGRPAANQALEMIIRTTLKLCRRMYIYARNKNDNIILKLINHSENTLASGSDKEKIRCCMTILSRAEWMHYFLEPYKVDSEYLTQLRHLLESYSLNDDHNRAMSGQMGLVHGLSDQINDLKDKIELLDELIEGLIKNDNFISRYHESRLIIDEKKVKAHDTNAVYKSRN